MKKISVLMAVLLALSSALAHAEDKGVVDKAGDEIKKGAQAAGHGIEKGAAAADKGIKKAVEATGHGLQKAGDWVEKKTGKSSDK